MKISKKIKQNITKTTDKEWCATGCYCIQYVFLTHPDTSITLTLPQYLCNLWHKRMIISTGRINQATILWSSTQGSYALALTHCLLPKLESQISQLVLLGVNWQQPLFEVVYKKHMDFTDFYSHTYNDFCFLSIKSEKFAKKKEKEVKERRTKCLYHTVYYRTYRNVRFPRPRNASTSIAWILLECKLLQDKTINESNTCNNKAKMQNTVSLQ